MKTPFLLLVCVGLSFAATARAAVGEANLSMVAGASGTKVRPITAANLPVNARIKYAAAEQIMSDAAQAKLDKEGNPDNTILARSTELLADYPGLTALWLRRAEIALKRGLAAVGHEAGMRLLELDAADSEDPATFKVLVRLAYQGWLNEDWEPNFEPHQGDEFTVRKAVIEKELRPDVDRVAILLADPSKARDEKAQAWKAFLKEWGFRMVDGPMDPSRVGYHRGKVALSRSSFGPPRAGRVYTNFLGMYFVPVPGTRVLLCAWETRVQDFKELYHDSNPNNGENAGDREMVSLSKGKIGRLGLKRFWNQPGFPQNNLSPVVGVDLDAAKEFCERLQNSGRDELSKGQKYRLPTDAEWTAAAGQDPFPWGAAWPPPAGVANLAGREARTTDWPADWGVLEGYADDFPQTAPAGSFAPNRYGIFDLGGNVWEWVGDRPNGLRGGSFTTSNRKKLLSATLESKEPGGYFDVGFRVVLDLGPSP